MSTFLYCGHNLVVWMWVLYLDGGSISSVKMLSVRALPIARSSRARSWAKVSPSRLSPSMAMQLSSSLATATHPTGRTTPMVISPYLDQFRNIRQI